MVSRPGELFRRSHGDETLGLEMRVISMGADERGAPFCLTPRQRGAGTNSGLVADGRKQISAAPDGADNSRLGRVGFDFAPDSHDAQVDGTIEGFAVARVGELQQPL